MSSTGVVLLRLTLAWMLSPDRSSSATARARNSEMRPHSTVFCALLRRRSRLLQIRREAVLALPTCARTVQSNTGGRHQTNHCLCNWSISEAILLARVEHDTAAAVRWETGGQWV